jgi:hypothetical protein
VQDVTQLERDHERKSRTFDSFDCRSDRARYVPGEFGKPQSRDHISEAQDSGSSISRMRNNRDLKGVPAHRTAVVTRRPIAIKPKNLQSFGRWMSGLFTLRVKFAVASLRSCQ